MSIVTEINVSSKSVESCSLSFTEAQLIDIRETIEKMTKFNQIEVLRMLHKHQDVILNENKNGIHVNLTELNDDIINELDNYIKYVNAQEQTLSKMEIQKENYRNTYFSKDIKI
jgi:hypothetical protein